MHTKRILELDGLRAFAVLFVVFYHMMHFSGAIPKVNSLVSDVVACAGTGGVHIFFVISGFIITSLLLRENEEKGKVSLSSFYQGGLFRIIPPFAAYLLTLYFLCELNYISTKPINFLYSSLFLGNLNLFGDSTTSNAWFVGHTWSLSVEEQYYLLLPPIMVIIFRFHLRPINILLIGLFFLSLFSLKLAKELSIRIHPDLIKISAFYDFRYIIIGVIFAIHRDTVRKIASWQSALFPISLVAIILAIYFIHLPPILSIILSGVEPVSYALLVIWFIENPAKCPILRWRIVQWIGACSYSVYLWQQLFTGKPEFYNGLSISQYSLTIIPIFACSALSYYLIEKPSIKLSRHFSRSS